MFLKNAWYVAAWSTEVTRDLMELMICEKSVVLYRTEKGDPVALGNMCPHRFAPLSEGQLIGDTVQCPYHGLQFGADGECALNPHGNGKVSPRMKVHAYPLVERYDMIWIWMGEVENADPTQIPNFSFNTDPGFRRIGGMFEVKANYELISDNIMDSTHGEFVHKGLLSSDGMLTSKLDTVQKGTTVWSNRFCPDDPPPPAWQMAFNEYSDNVDLWFYARWDAPSHLVFDVGISPAGRPRSEGIWLYGTDILTPIDKTTTRYFWAFARDYALEDEKVDDFWHEAIKVAFEEQDKNMFESQQRLMGDRTFEELDPIIIAPDAAAMRARRVLAKLIADENNGLPVKLDSRGGSPLDLLKTHKESANPVEPVT